MKFKQFISTFLVFLLIVSSVPEYAVLAYSESKEDVETTKSKEEVISTDNLEEVTSERTTYTKTFTDGEGKYYKEIYAEPIHSKQGKVFEDIDDTLTEETGGTLSTENTALEADFPEKIKDDQSIIYKKGSHQLQFNLTKATQNGENIKPNLASKTEVEDNKIQYNEIYPNIDLRHITFNEEVKEDWIVNKYTGIHQFEYTVKTDLKPILQQDGSVGFFLKTDENNAIFTLPKPVMMDSNINDQKGDGVYSDEVQFKITEINDNTYTLVLDADEEWLQSDERVYPVYIDPSVTIDALGDTYISSKYPKTNFNKQWDAVQGEYVLQAGYYDSTSGTNYPFIKFEVVDELRGATIESASLQTYVTHAYYADQKNGLWVDEVKGAWYANELTWNNKPSSTKVASTSVGRDE